ncbi:MAG: fluoride efflux transporter CrcB [Candidatus Binataceae bacterium]
MLSYLAIAIGSAIGGMARYFFSGVIMNLAGVGFPYGTLFVNVTGAMIIGFIATATGPDGRLIAGTHARQFLMVGICGGYTTFSSFSLETLNLMRDGEMIPAAANAIASVILCLAAVWIGHIAATVLNRGV